MGIEFPDEDRDRMAEALQRYVHVNLEVDMGVLQTDRLVEFLVGLIGAASYNRGVADAQAYLQGKLIDLEIDLHERVDYRP